MIKFIVTFAVRALKNRVIIFDNAVTNSDLTFIVARNSLSFIRGLIRLRRFVFLGRSVKLLSKRKLILGKGVTIGDFSSLDGLGEEGLSIGSGSSIGSYSLLKVSGTLTSIGKKIIIGENVGIGDFSHIGGAGGVQIGDNTIAGAYLSIHPENHIFANNQTLIREQGVTRKGIFIGSNCWIGAKVTVLDGSVIGNGCVVAAGAVVNGVFPDNFVIGGVPARILKER